MTTISTISSIEVIGAIEVYLKNNDRPCPAHYLTEKFGDDVVEVINELKKDGKIIGRRGRNGGIVFPDNDGIVFPNAVVEVKPVIVDQEAVELLNKVNSIIESQNSDSTESSVSLEGVV